VVDTLRISSPATIEKVDPTIDPRWAGLAESHGSLFTSPPWLSAIGSTYGFVIDAWLDLDQDGVARGGIPAARLGNSRGERLVALPFSDYCDPIDTGGSSSPVLVDHLLAQGLPVEVRRLDGEQTSSDTRWTSGEPDLWHAIDLEPDEGRAWETLTGSARRAIRKGRDSGIEIRVSDDLTALRTFYELHLGIRKHKYRLLAQPFEFFLALAENFGDRLVLLGAWQGETLVAGVLYLAWGDTLYYKFNASSGTELGARPNDLLMWEGTRYAVSAGLSTVDLGRTDADHESLARYKSKYATREGSITVLRNGVFERDPALSAILGPLTELMTRPEVPDEITEAVGELTYRHFA
jgi:hypothetical protein